MRLILFLILFTLAKAPSLATNLQLTSNTKPHLTEQQVPDSVSVTQLAHSLFDVSNSLSSKEVIIKAKEVISQLDLLHYRFQHNAHFEKIRAECLHIICNCYRDLGQLDSTDFYITQLKKLNIKDAQFLWAVNKARSSMLQLEYEKALDAFYTGLELVSNSNQTDKYTYLLLEINEFYMTHHAFKSAEETLNILIEKINELSLQNNEMSKALIFGTMLQSVKLQSLKDRYDSAIFLLKKIDTTEIFSIDKYSKWAYNIYYVTEAEIQLENGQFEKALEALKKATGIRGINENDNYAVLLLYAQIYWGFGNIGKAEFYLTKSSDTHDVYSAEDLPILKLEGQIKAQKGDYKGANESFKKYVEMNDSVNSIRDKVGDAIIKYKLRKDNEILALERESQKKELFAKQRFNNIILITVILVFLLILVFVFVYFRKERKRVQMQLEIDKERKMAQYKTSFIQNLSHELRTPLATMSGFLQLILTYNLDLAKIKEYSKLALQNNERVISSLNNFLTLLKLEYSEFTIRPLPDLFLSRVKSTVMSFGPVAFQKQIKIYFRSNLSNDLNIKFPFDILDLIINNLISNAIKYSPKNRAIYFSIIHKNNILNIMVKDQGLGIPKDDLNKVFDRFYQSAKHSNSGGFGIGLSLVNQLVHQLSGTVTVESTETIGTTFLVKLPIQIKSEYITDINPEFESISISLESKDETINKIESSSRVLLVDDDHDMLVYLKELLSEEFQCDCVYNGQEALEMSSKHTYDLIISDYRMPVMNGLELKQALIKSEAGEQIPFIMITGSVLEIPESTMQDIGITDYILKPFDNKELMSRIRFLTDTNLYKKSLYSDDESISTFNASQIKVINDVKKTIKSHLSNANFSAINLAMEVGYSHQQLNQIVKKTTGMTLSKIILELRLLRAYECIIKRQFQTVSEIAHEIGIKSRPYFYKTFEDRFGIKPGDLLKRMNG